MTTDFTLIWPLSCLKDVVHLCYPSTRDRFAYQDDHLSPGPALSLWGIKITLAYLLPITAWRSMHYVKNRRLLMRTKEQLARFIAPRASSQTDRSTPIASRPWSSTMRATRSSCQVARLHGRGTRQPGRECDGRDSAGARGRGSWPPAPMIPTWPGGSTVSRPSLGSSHRVREKLAARRPRVVVEEPAQSRRRVPVFGRVGPPRCHVCHDRGPGRTLCVSRGAQAVSGHCRPRPRAGAGGPCALTRCRVVRGGEVMRCAGRRDRPRGVAGGLAPPAPAAPDRRPAGPRRQAIPAR